MCWIHNMSGDFITCSQKVGALRIWNASQKTPKAVIKVGAMGIRAFVPFASNPSHYIAVFKDGSLGLLNLQKKKLVWSIEAGHSETIFDLRFKPSDSSLLATGSYDGYIKVWDTQTMRLTATLSLSQTRSSIPDDPAQIVYSISWAPGQDTRLVSAHANGDIVLWDYAKNKLMFRFKPGGASPIYRVDWNPLSRDFIAAGSSEGDW